MNRSLRDDVVQSGMERMYRKELQRQKGGIPAVFMDYSIELLDAELPRESWIFVLLFSVLVHAK